MAWGFGKKQRWVFTFKSSFFLCNTISMDQNEEKLQVLNEICDKKSQIMKQRQRMDFDHFVVRFRKGSNDCQLTLSLFVCITSLFKAVQIRLNQTALALSPKLCPLIYVRELILFSFDIFKKEMIWIPLILMLAGYLAFSWLLFFFPTLLHKPHLHPRVPSFIAAILGRKVLRIAHRGGPRHVTENTIEAFEKSKEISDMLEMDVCETKDGVLVVHHDHDLQRTCGVKGYIRDYTFKDLPPFRQMIELNFAAEGVSVKSKGQHIPTLQQIFKSFPETPLNIEIKTPSEAAIKQMIRLVRQYKRQHITIVGIRGDDQDKLKALDRKMMVFMRDREYFKYTFAMIIGLLPFLYAEEHTLQVPLWTKDTQDWKCRQWGRSWKVRAFFWVIRYIMNPLMGLMAYHFRKRGIMTYFWVCNTEEEYQRAIYYGASGIMTDDPPLLHNYLKKRYPDQEQTDVTVTQQQQIQKKQL